MTRAVLPRPGSSRSTRRRRFRRRILGAAVVVALAGTLTLGVARLGAAATGSGGAAPGTSGGATPATVLLIGDSLMHQAASGIRDALPGSKVVDGSIPGTGLLNGAVDWPTQAAALIALYHPDVVVVSFVGNYDQSEGNLAIDSDAYFAAWAAAAQKLTDELRASVARVDWVAQPPLRDQNFYGVAPIRTDLLLAQYRRLATESGVGLVNEVSSVASADGSFTRTESVCGRTVVMRINDGVHFTAVGGDWWGASLGRGIARLENLPVRDACSVMTDLAPNVF